MKKLALLLGCVAILMSTGCDMLRGEKADSEQGATSQEPGGIAGVNVEQEKNRAAIERAFDLVQKKSSEVKVFEEIKPVFDKGGLTKLPLESKCKLEICYYYIFDQDKEILAPLKGTPGKEEFDQQIKPELKNSKDALDYFNSMEGKAKQIAMDLY